MTIVDIKCIVCGQKYQDELRKYFRGKLEICEECKRKREIYQKQKEMEIDIDNEKGYMSR